MKIIFIGSVTFSKYLLEYMINKNLVEVIGVCTKKSSSFNSDFFDLSQICKKHEIDFRYCKKINEKKNIQWIKKKSPDYIFCFGWSELLSHMILKIPKFGSIGYHPSLLPQNRGRHPIIWTIALGLKFIGSTFFWMTKKADDGQIINQNKIKVSVNDDSKIVYRKIIKSAIIQIKNFIPKLSHKKRVIIRPNNKNKKGNYWRKRSYLDGQIDWRMSALNIFNLTRALTFPYPYSHFVHNGKKIEILKAKIVKFNKLNIEPGKVIDFKNKKYITVRCGDNALKIINYKPKITVKIGEYIK